MWTKMQENPKILVCSQSAVKPRAPGKLEIRPGVLCVETT